MLKRNSFARLLKKPATSLPPRRQQQCPTTATTTAATTASLTSLERLHRYDTQRSTRATVDHSAPTKISSSLALNRQEACPATEEAVEEERQRAVLTLLFPSPFSSVGVRAGPHTVESIVSKLWNWETKHQSPQDPTVFPIRHSVKVNTSSTKTNRLALLCSMVYNEGREEKGAETATFSYPNLQIIHLLNEITKEGLPFSPTSATSNKNNNNNRYNVYPLWLSVKSEMHNSRQPSLDWQGEQGNGSKDASRAHSLSLHQYYLTQCSSQFLTLYKKQMEKERVEEEEECGSFIDSAITNSILTHRQIVFMITTLNLILLAPNVRSAFEWSSKLWSVFHETLLKSKEDQKEEHNLLHGSHPIQYLIGCALAAFCCRLTASPHPSLPPSEVDESKETVLAEGSLLDPVSDTSGGSLSSESLFLSLWELWTTEHPLPSTVGKDTVVHHEEEGGTPLTNGAYLMQFLTHCCPSALSAVDTLKKDFLSWYLHCLLYTSSTSAGEKEGGQHRSEEVISLLQTLFLETSNDASSTVETSTNITPLYSDNNNNNNNIRNNTKDFGKVLSIPVMEEALFYFNENSSVSHGGSTTIYWSLIHRSLAASMFYEAKREILRVVEVKLTVDCGSSSSAIRRHIQHHKTPLFSHFVLLTSVLQYFKSELETTLLSLMLHPSANPPSNSPEEEKERRRSRRSGNEAETMEAATKIVHDVLFLVEYIHYNSFTRSFSTYQGPAKLSDLLDTRFQSHRKDNLEHFLKEIHSLLSVVFSFSQYLTFNSHGEGVCSTLSSPHKELKEQLQRVVVTTNELVCQLVTRLRPVEYSRAKPSRKEKRPKYAANWMLQQQTARDGTPLVNSNQKRTHQCEYLLAEIPHGVLVSDLLSQFYVEKGFLRESLQLMNALLHNGDGRSSLPSTPTAFASEEKDTESRTHSFVDLHSYPLHLLGSLLQSAMLFESNARAEETTSVSSTAVAFYGRLSQQLKSLYRRRQEVFGDHAAVTWAPQEAQDATSIPETPITYHIGEEEEEEKGVSVLYTAYHTPYDGRATLEKALTSLFPHLYGVDPSSISFHPAPLTERAVSQIREMALLYTLQYQSMRGGGSPRGGMIIMPDNPLFHIGKSRKETSFMEGVWRPKGTVSVSAARRMEEE